ncbi:MAG: hypothetical protein LBD84_00550 [Campylobacteraceae bacterium]|nr:hypothetical protein [Campylobacteraceae bacterium]
MIKVILHYSIAAVWNVMISFHRAYLIIPESVNLTCLDDLQIITLKDTT